MKNVHLMIIDPQNDFCDPKGALSVPGADADMDRLSEFIKRTGDKLTDIHVTLDSHHLVDIAHPIFWKNTKGEHPEPFTIITKDDVKEHNWVPTNPSFYKKALSYVDELEKEDRYQLCIWPPHCLIGSNGHNVYNNLYNALLDWEQDFAMVNYITKGSNIWTEHYSALKADVPDPMDPSTQVDTNFIKTLTEADEIVVAGEAGSHCLANSVRDVVDAGGEELLKKIVLLEDCTSPVPGFESLQEDFIEEMKNKGMRVVKSTEYMK